MTPKDDLHHVSVATSVVLSALPNEFHGLWLTTEELVKCVQDGGIAGMDKKTVAAAMRSDQHTFKRNKYRRAVHFMLGEPRQHGWSPKQQYQCCYSLPSMPPRYFTKLDELKDVVSILKKHFSPPRPTPSVTTRAAAAAAASFSNSESSSKSHSTTLNGRVDDTPTPLRTGFVQQDIDMDHEWTSMVLAHGRKCRCSKLVPLEDVKKGFEVISKYQCAFCNEVLTKRRSPNDQTPTHRGSKGSAINLNLAHAIFASGINVQKALELFAEAGIECPTPSVMQELVNKVKDSVLNVTDEQLRLNRKEHVAACRSAEGYSGDLVFTDSEGKEHHVARGAGAADGGGETRAYNHHITGSQHCLIMFSLVTYKPIYVHNHQISCKRCSMAFTESMKKALEEGKSYHDLSSFSTKHPGRCYKNTNLTPAVAEEYACEQAADFLLRGTDGKSILPDDEAIFIDEFISDGDTRGAKKFIAKQAGILGDIAKDVAQYFPDFGHFIKCISNALYHLRDKDSSYRGVGLLESSRIKALSSDVSNHLRGLHRLLELQPSMTDEQKLEAKRRCLNNIRSIVPHHCGDHSHCSPDHCLFKDIQRHLRARQSVTGETFSTEDVKERYAERSRFRGKTMSISQRGREKLQRVIMDRITMDNIERLARVLSSNCCESYFSCLIKYSQGKRINYGQANTWEVLQDFVVGLKSKEDYTTDVLLAAGGIETAVRRTALARQRKRKANQLASKARPANKIRRKMGATLKLARVEKEDDKKSCHRSDKLPPTSSCKSSETNNTRKRKRCSNCHDEGHCITDCQEANVLSLAKNLLEISWRTLSRMVFHSCTTSPGAPPEWKGHSVTMFVRQGNYQGSQIIHPRLEWPTPEQQWTTERPGTVNLMDIHTISDSSEDDVRDDIEADTTEPMDLCFFSITTKDGQVYMFESGSPAERDWIVTGLKNIIVRLAYHLTVGDPGISSELFSGEYEYGGGDLPTLKTPVQAMNEVAHAFLD